MRSHGSFSLIVAVVLAAAANLGCGIVGPSCTDETGVVLDRTGEVRAGDTAPFDVTSPKHSNLRIRLTWPETTATLAVRATIINCGEHAGCQMDTVITPPFGPGGPSPTPQPWPPGVREMLVDGTRGKTWRIELSGDPMRDASFRLSVQYDISCER
jgi:hypothetical protein